MLNQPPKTTTLVALTNREPTRTEPDVTSPIRKRLIAAAVALGTVFGVAGVAGAVTGQTDNTNDDATRISQDDDGDLDESGEADDDDAGEDDEMDDDDADRHGDRDGDRVGETPLEDDLANQVATAALDAIPGATIVRVETDADGAAYEAHVIDADGNPVNIRFDQDLNVVDTQAGKSGGDRHRGHGGGGSDEGLVIGDLTAKLSAAAEEAVPGGTVEQVESEGDGYEVHVTTSDGDEVEVHFDAELDVVDVEQG